MNHRREFSFLGPKIDELLDAKSRLDSLTLSCFRLNSVRFEAAEIPTYPVYIARKIHRHDWM